MRLPQRAHLTKRGRVRSAIRSRLFLKTVYAFIYDSVSEGPGRVYGILWWRLGDNRYRLVFLAGRSRVGTGSKAAAWADFRVAVACSASARPALCPVAPGSPDALAGRFCWE